MADDIKVSIATKSQIKGTSGYSYSFQKFNDKNNNGAVDKDELIGSIMVNDYEGDGFDSHDGAINKNFGNVTNNLFDSMTPGYQDVSAQPVNPASGKAYVDAKGKKETNGSFTITSPETEEFSLGSLAKNAKNAPATTTTETSSYYNQIQSSLQSSIYSPGFCGCGTPNNPQIPQLNPDYNKLNAVYNYGVNTMTLDYSGYGFGGPCSADFATIKAPGRAVDLWNTVYAAFGGMTGGASQGINTGAGVDPNAAKIKELETKITDLEAKLKAGSGTDSPLTPIGSTPIVPSSEIKVDADKAKADADAKAKAEADAKAKAKAKEEEEAKAKADADAANKAKKVTINKYKPYDFNKYRKEILAKTAPTDASKINNNNLNAQTHKKAVLPKSNETDISMFSSKI